MKKVQRRQKFTKPTKKREKENEAFSYRVKEPKISVNLEHRSKSSESETEGRKLSGGGGRSAVELTEDVKRSDEADEAEAHDEHDSWQDLQEGGWADSMLDFGGISRGFGRHLRRLGWVLAGLEVWVFVGFEMNICWHWRGRKWNEESEGEAGRLTEFMTGA